MNGRHRVPSARLGNLLASLALHVTRAPKRAPCGVIGLLRALIGLCATVVLSQSGWAQGFLLVAKPGLTDPNFAQTVVLATPTEEGVTIGFVLNRPLAVSLAQMLPEHPHLSRFVEPLRQGGPVNATGLFALYRGPRPKGPVEQAAEDLYFAIEKVTVEELISGDESTIRFYSGYAGWAPGQLEAEVEQGAWWILPLDDEAVHRTDPSRLWDDMVRRAQAVTAGLHSSERVSAVLSPGRFSSASRQP